jgi:hypothetical protein
MILLKHLVERVSCFGGEAVLRLELLSELERVILVCHHEPNYFVFRYFDIYIK